MTIGIGSATSGGKKRRKSSAERRIERALALAFRHRALKDPAHLRWVVDQMVRALAGSRYELAVQAALLGAHDPTWDRGTRP